MNPLETGLALLACATVLTLWGWLARLKRVQLVKWEHAQKAFYRHASQLMENPQVPDEIVGFLEFSSNMIGRKSAVALFILLALADREVEPEEAESSRLFHAASRLPSRARESFFEALSAFFTSLGWRSLLLGWLFRWASRPVRKPSDDGNHNGAAAELHLVERACARAA